ncbi:hypothetical protein AVEN_125216-1 [Araneus ventricosus]|uniref:Tc1-like transposase DDE domain-containing protein n=1 Tax=Araneus ventricosus TaxID=182803 RepID=A0A4Y2TE30_ARAVE|nr:hypothetical protein AVEN_125216-1 [Araneus ventricosus]
MLKSERLKCTFFRFQLRNVWFQHDGVPAHETSSVKQYLVEEFGVQIIGYGGFQEWPSRSPDLTPMDFSCGDTPNSDPSANIAEPSTTHYGCLSQRDTSYAIPCAK